MSVTQSPAAERSYLVGQAPAPCLSVCLLSHRRGPSPWRPLSSHFSSLGLPTGAPAQDPLLVEPVGRERARGATRTWRNEGEEGPLMMPGLPYSWGAHQPQGQPGKANQPLTFSPPSPPSDGDFGVKQQLF